MKTVEPIRDIDAADFAAESAASWQRIMVGVAERQRQRKAWLRGLRDTPRKREQFNKMPRGRPPTLLTHNGRALSIRQWATIVGILPLALRRRLRAGWPLERALTEPSRKKTASSAQEGPSERQAAGVASDLAVPKKTGATRLTRDATNIEISR